MPRLLLAALALLLATAPAAAKSARCFTSDDGEYACNFTATDRAGSFEISAPGKPTVILVVNARGVASGFVNFGDRNVSLPGLYLRSKSDPACWVNDSTGTKVCAW